MTEEIASSTASVSSGLTLPPTRSAYRLAKYILSRAIILTLTVAIGLYLTIMVVNLGGYVDKVFSAYIDENIGAMIQDGWLKDTPEPERTQTINQTRETMAKALGLDQPFLLRSVRWLARGMILDLGRTSVVYNRTNFITDDVRAIVLKHLPYTLILVGITNLIIFITSIFVALIVSRNYGSWLDRGTLLLVPLTSAPSWVFGIFLIYIFINQLRIIPYPQAFNLMLNRPSPQLALLMLRQLILPVLAIFLSTFFIGVYTWRTFFLIYRHEDYVDMAVAKGLTDPQIERRYILRPALPYVLTSFALMMIVAWQSAIALEVLFLWPGLGLIFVSALPTFNTPMIIGIVVIFAYLLVITVFVLDITYALVDPRVTLSSQQQIRSKPARMAKSTRRSQSSDRVDRSLIEPMPATIEMPDGQTRERHSSWSLAGVLYQVRIWLGSLVKFLKELLRYPLGAVGLATICIMIAIAAGTMIFIPYEKILLFWRGQGTEEFENNWIKNPRYAQPEWVNWFRKEKLPVTQIINSKDLNAEITTEQASKDTTEISIPFRFNFTADELPQDLILFLTSSSKNKTALVALSLQAPDGRKFDLGTMSVKSQANYYLSLDQRLMRRLQATNNIRAIFGDPTSGLTKTIRGVYELDVTAFLFEPGSTLEVEAVLYGQVFGLAGTDNMRRDLSLALLWGLPVALTFGILGAILTNLLAMGLAAMGVWFSGWTDSLIQRISEVNMILPTLPIIILVYLMVSKSIWVIMAALVVLSIFGSALKNYRAVFLQIKEAPYMESAQSYGASSWRIIWRYLIPPVLPVLIPQMVIMVPVYVFYEATLAFLGVSDPNLPTWGKVIYEALASHAIEDYPFWLFEPLVLIVITSLAFAFLGLALDRMFNPRLRAE